MFSASKGACSAVACSGKNPGPSKTSFTRSPMGGRDRKLAVSSTTSPNAANRSLTNP